MKKMVFTKTQIRSQILLGIILCACNLGVMFLQRLNPVPLYMDTLFTITAAFFGPISGCICATLFHLTCALFIDSNKTAFIWSICSYTIVLIIRMYIKKRSKIERLDILLLIFIIAIIISIEGALIFTILNILSTYTELSQVRLMYGFLSRNNLPTFVAALLPRVPVNILDKGICVSLGYLSYKGLSNFLSSKKGKSDKQKEKDAQ